MRIGKAPEDGTVVVNEVPCHCDTAQAEQQECACIDAGAPAGDTNRDSYA